MTTQPTSIGARHILGDASRHDEAPDARLQEAQLYGTDAHRGKRAVVYIRVSTSHMEAQDEGEPST